MLPPGPLRKAMYERVAQNGELKRGYFSLDRFGEVAAAGIYPECLIILFNETLAVANGHVSHADKSSYTALSKFILPSSYHKLANIDPFKRRMIGRECLEAFMSPIPGTEEHFNSENFFNAFFKTFEFTDSNRRTYIDLTLEERPLLALEVHDEIDKLCASYAMRGLIKMRKEGNKALKMAEPHLAKYVQVLRKHSGEENKLQNYYEDILININQDDQVQDLPCKKVRITSSKLFDNGNVSLPDEIVLLLDTTVPSMVNKSHSISSMTSNMSNPKVFFKVLNDLDRQSSVSDNEYFAQMYHLMKPLMSARNMEYCRTFARLNSINLFNVGSVKVKELPKTNYRIRAMLHSLFFHVGCFGEHMDDGMREMLEAVAELFYPHEVAQLKAVIKLVGLTPNIVDLLHIAYIDHVWVYEFYGKLYDAEQNNDMVNVFDNKDAFDKLKYTLPKPSRSEKNSSSMSQLRKEQIVEKLERLGRYGQAQDLRHYDPVAFPMKSNKRIN